MPITLLKDAAADVLTPATDEVTIFIDDSTGDLKKKDETGTVSSVGGSVLPSVCDGRLTLTSGTPITTGDVTSATSIYFTPYRGNHLSLYTSSVWTDYTFTEVTFALGTLTNGANYDLFVWDNSGTVTLSKGPAWSSDTSRGTGAGTTELESFEGVYVNKVAISGGPGARAGRYVGTFRTTSTTTTEDSGGGVTTQVGGKRFLWNHYHRVARPLGVIDTTDNWAYTTNTVRQANGASGNKIEYVAGLADVVVDASLIASIFAASTSTRTSKAGIGVDSTTAFSGLVATAAAWTSISVNYTMAAAYKGYPGLGYHYIAWLEKGGDGTANFLGDDGGGGAQSGLSVLLV